MDKIRLKKTSVLSIVLSVVILTFFAMQVDATTLLPSGISDTGKQAAGLNGITKLVINAVNVLLGISASLALLFTIIGGFYMTIAGIDSGNIAKGKRMVVGSAIGILIVFSAYTMVNFVFSTADISQSKWTKPGVAPKPKEVMNLEIKRTIENKTASLSDTSEQTLRDYFKANGISINNNACTPTIQTNCTNVENLPQSAVNGLIAIKTIYGKELVISGGTELSGHGAKTEHGPNQPVADIRQTDKSANNADLRQILLEGSGEKRQVTTENGTFNGYTYNKNGLTFNWLDEGGHIHVKF